MAHQKNKNSRNKPQPRPYAFRHGVDADESIQSKHYPNESQTKSKSLDSLFISREITTSAMNHIPFRINESFADAESLYYHLNWQSTIQKKGGKCKLINGLIIFHAELHSGKSPIYIVADSDSWRMIKLMQAQELQTYGIKQRALPLMSRPDIKEHMLADNEYVKKLIAFRDKLDLKKLNHFLQGNNKIIAKDASRAQRMNEQSVIVGKSSFVELIKSSITKSIYNKDKHRRFQHFIYFHKKPGHVPGYSVRVLVPIEIKDNNWIAMTFEHDGRTLNAKKILTDDVDVRRKLHFYDPSNLNKFDWFKNNFIFSPVDDHIAQQNRALMDNLHQKEVENRALMGLLQLCLRQNQDLRSLLAQCVN